VCSEESEAQASAPERLPGHQGAAAAGRCRRDFNSTACWCSWGKVNLELKLSPLFLWYRGQPSQVHVPAFSCYSPCLHLGPSPGVDVPEPSRDRPRADEAQRQQQLHHPGRASPGPPAWRAGAGLRLSLATGAAGRCATLNPMPAPDSAGHQPGWARQHGHGGRGCCYCTACCCCCCCIACSPCDPRAGASGPGVCRAEYLPCAHCLPCPLRRPACCVLYLLLWLHATWSGPSHSRGRAVIAGGRRWGARACIGARDARPVPPAPQASGAGAMPGQRCTWLVSGKQPPRAPGWSRESSRPGSACTPSGTRGPSLGLLPGGAAYACKEWAVVEGLEGRASRRSCHGRNTGPHGREETFRGALQTRRFVAGDHSRTRGAERGTLPLDFPEWTNGGTRRYNDVALTCGGQRQSMREREAAGDGRLQWGYLGTPFQYRIVDSAYESHDTTRSGKGVGIDAQTLPPPVGSRIRQATLTNCHDTDTPE